MTRTALLGGLAVLAITSSCATTFYQGDAKPDSQVAVITSSDTVVDEIDGNDVQKLRGGAKGRFVLPPGPHVIGFSFHKVTPGFFVTTTTRSNYLRVCLLAEPGAHYVTKALHDEESWSPAIYEGDEDGPTPSSGRPLALDCAYQRLFAKSPAAPVVPRPTVAAPAAAGPSATEVETPEGTGDSEGAPATPEPPAALDPQRPAGRLAASLWRRLPIWRPAARPMFDVLWNLGGGFGGATLVRATTTDGDSETLAAGTGVASSVGLMYTPLWLAGDFVGLGIGTEIGVKLDSISASNGKVSLTRFPASGTLHALVRTADQWFVLLSGGVEKDLGVDLSGEGVGSVVNGLNDLTGQPGGRFRLGMYYRESDIGSVTFGLGYTTMKYGFPGGTIDASSFNLWLSVNAGIQTIGQGQPRERGPSTP